jgi:preprotein translocase subunit SecD
MRLIFPWLLLLLLTILPAQAGSSPPKVLLRVNVQTTGEGLPATMATTISVPPDGEEIEIRALPEVTEKDLIDVKQNPDNTVRFFFNHRGQVNLSAATADNQGRLLVLLIDGYVAYAPIIDQEISNGELDVPHPLNPQIIKLLQEVAQRNVREAR